MRCVPLAASPRDYEHPSDRALSTALRSNPSFRVVLTDTAGGFGRAVSDWILGELLAETVEVTIRQFSDLHRLFSEMVAIVDLRPAPRLFILGDPVPNAFTVGVESQANVIITSSLLEQLEEPGLSFVLGHELGHVRSEHTLITTAAVFMAEARASRNKPLDQRFADAYLEWSRVSEVTADRAGLLACQDADGACRALLTILLGSRTLAARVNLGEYRQCQSAEARVNPQAVLSQRHKTHPLIPMRIEELLKFSASGAYARLLQQGLTLGEVTGPARAAELTSAELAAIETLEIRLG